MPLPMTQPPTLVYRSMPFRYLWPIAIVVSLVIALWAQFPWQLHVLAVPAVTQPQQLLPTVAYVTIDEASINQLVKRAASEWMQGSGSNARRRLGLDLTTLEASLAPPAQRYLEKGSILPSTWRADDVLPVPVTTPVIAAPETAGAPNASPPVPLRDTFNTRLSASLQAAKFTVPLFVNTLKSLSASSGQCRFYLECNATGDVEHVVRLSPPTPDGSVVERALMRGKADGPTSGCIDIEWMLIK